MLKQSSRRDSDDVHNLTKQGSSGNKFEDHTTTRDGKGDHKHTHTAYHQKNVIAVANVFFRFSHRDK